MADFIAVIRRAVTGLPNNTPEMRTKVYDKARAAVRRQLETMNPRPSEEMLKRQLDKLEAAILEVDSEYAEALPAIEDAFPETPDHSDAYAEPQASEPEVVEPAEASDVPVQEHQPYEYQASPYADEPVTEAPSETYGETDRVEYEAEPEPEPEVREPPVVEQEAVAAAEPYSEPAHEPEPTVESVEPENTAVVYGWEPEPETPREQVSVEAEAIEPPATTGEEPHWPEAEPPVWAQPPVEPAPTYETAPVEHQDEPAAAVSLESSPFDEWERSMEASRAAAAEPVEQPVEESVAPAYDPYELHVASVDAPVVEPSEPDLQPTAEQPRAVEMPAAGLDLLDWEPHTTTTPSGKGDPLPVDDFSDWMTPAAAGAAGATASTRMTEALDELEFEPTTGKPTAPGTPADGDFDELMAATEAKAYKTQTTKKRSLVPLLLGLAGLVIVAGGGYAVWTNKDAMSEFVTGLVSSASNGTDEQPAEIAATESEATPPAETTPAAETPAAQAPAEGEVAGRKFTQRLLANGTEVDEGDGSLGTGEEGRSVSEQTVAASETPAAQAPAGATTTPVVPPVEAGAATAAGERAIIYEERLGQATPTAINGRIEWSVSREIGASGRPEPAVQGKLLVPENGLSALITFKLNTDNSLPASHLIEVVFSVPPTFEGGAIEDVQRVAMKRTEQDRGDPLVAVSAKITEDTFLIALNDFQDVVARNLDLLRTRNWIDIPVTYRNGRRALLTLDKGATGVSSFQTVIQEWSALGTTNGG